MCISTKNSRQLGSEILLGSTGVAFLSDSESKNRLATVFCRGDVELQDEGTARLRRRMYRCRGTSTHNDRMEQFGDGRVGKLAACGIAGGRCRRARLTLDVADSSRTDAAYS